MNRIASLLVLGLLISQAQPARSATFTITDLGLLGGIESRAVGVNASGQVVVNVIGSDLSQSVYVWTNGSAVNIGSLGGNTLGAGINASGEVVGRSWNGLTTHAFLYSGGTMNDLGTLGGALSSAWAINDSGQVVGEAQGPNYAHAFLHDGVMNDLGTISGTNSTANGVNASGQVVGTANYVPDDASLYHAFLYSGGNMTDLGTLGGDESYASGINAAGDVVGTAQNGSAVDRAFLYSGGVMNDLGTLGGLGSQALAINTAGDVVGTAQDAFATYRAFLYQNGVMQDLNDLVDPGSGWLLQNATALNDNGQIVGFGLVGGQQHAFLLTLEAVPEPGSMTLVGVAVSAAGFFRRRRNRTKVHGDSTTA